MGGLMTLLLLVATVLIWPLFWLFLPAAVFTGWTVVSRAAAIQGRVIPTPWETQRRRRQRRAMDVREHYERQGR
jgi:hypothetical protein